MRRPAAILAALALTSAALAVGGPASLARFTSADDRAGAFHTGILLPPAALAGSGGAIASLTWTPTVSAAEGYRVMRSATSGSGYTQVALVTPRTASSTTNSPANGVWYFVLRSYLANWSSADSNEVRVTVGGTTTGFVNCTPASNAADTGGDGNGYQTYPRRGCVTDGSVASDARSGTSTIDSCTDPGKDRHRYWGFALGMPPAVASINGLELRVVMGMNNNGGTSRLCAELSWDGGTTWTTPKSVSLAGTTLTTYTLGGTADTWGRAWTVGQLGTNQLLVRLTDVSTQPNKTFRLDGLSLRVSYTP